MGQSEFGGMSNLGVGDNKRRSQYRNDRVDTNSVTKEEP
jgi:hypothetical protein